MPLGYTVLRQKVGNQTEDNFVAGIAPNGQINNFSGRLTVPSIPIGGVAYGSLGTNTTDVSGQLWITDLFLPYNRVVSTIGVLAGGTATTDNWLAAIYDSYGVLIASTAVAGKTLSGANTFQTQAIALTYARGTTTGATAATSVQLFGPQQYFVVVQGNGTAAGAFRTVATATYIDVIATSVSGTFGTVPATITVPTTFTADKAPIVYLQ
jgi:hypothetical protein